MIERIRQLMEHLGQSSSQFADSMEVPRAVLSHIMSGRNKPSLDVIIKLLAKNEEVNPNWLLHGKGEMLMKVAENSVPESASKAADVAHPREPVAKPDISESTAKVQNDPFPEMPLPPPYVGKKIKQVILIYTDNTFTALSPEQ
ncbi:helix-turn-helix transcriptional regulator [Pontibacter sp. Tf4]|uniref:helix-turn-helix domain-containing protein n=1 Tax=Pontibacter sp. Tf4 TaxID=2761620 RepID=UPI00162AC35A|nr:helix-turn-helix transcriptional regulator [Pontibacter sp. Tf4]MBB6610365.1 helix-turn-helix transcriptional regulator [Pontibacter sp. Tf4]